MKIKLLILWVKNDADDIITVVKTDWFDYVNLKVSTTSGTFFYEDKYVLDFKDWLEDNDIEGGIIEREIDISEEFFNA